MDQSVTEKINSDVDSIFQTLEIPSCLGAVTDKKEVGIEELKDLETAEAGFWLYTFPTVEERIAFDMHRMGYKFYTQQSKNEQIVILEVPIAEFTRLRAQIRRGNQKIANTSIQKITFGQDGEIMYQDIPKDDLSVMVETIKSEYNFQSQNHTNTTIVQRKKRQKTSTDIETYYNSTKQKKAILHAFLKSFPELSLLNVIIELTGNTDVNYIQINNLAIAVVIDKLEIIMEVTHVPCVANAFADQQNKYRFTFSALPKVTTKGYTIVHRPNLYSHEKIITDFEGNLILTTDDANDAERSLIKVLETIMRTLEGY